ncbi:hypothetical protein AJ80_03324 [Polytolypa hystricis UAMH7299]|uniref:RNA polymerase II subunit B1 CTD phosphatase RPAP2 homolog n=1 Tax=Polytolypa hystricis (strain UAMH7299) TaxID=1447883 RepID=A0A2B7YLC1_POLH7|nr:hypothetical protein AJ80_03324 [Polytolypa hystricis UAMH7299]
MVDNSVPPNPILKNSIPALHASSAASDEKPSSPPRQTKKPTTPNPRHLAIALHHAHQIQARKDTETLVLSHIETLLELPSSPNATASDPSTEDVAAFKSALLPFQPSDYDNLIIERNIEGRCGYTLCPNPHRREDPKAKFRIVWGAKGSGPGGRGKEMKVVPKELIEKWCSDECAERAMYIRVQLIEQPAWERSAGSRVQIVLLEEGRGLRNTQDALPDGKGKRPARDMTEVEEKMRKLDVGDAYTQDPDVLAKEVELLNVGDIQGSSSGAQAEQLAMERGDKKPAVGLDAGRVDIGIFEKQHRATPVSAPSLDATSVGGGSIEGFEPKAISNREGKRREVSHEGAEDEDEDEDEDDDILQCI